MILPIQILLIAHFLGDYYFQSRQLAEQKQKSISVLLKHVLIHFVLYLLVAALFFSLHLLYLAIVLALFHFILDYSKSVLFNKPIRLKGLTRLNQSFALYTVDQLLHIAIVFISIFVLSQFGSFQLHPAILHVFQTFHVDPIVFTKVALIVTILIQPANITMRLFLDQFNFQFGEVVQEKEVLIKEESENVNLRQAKQESRGLENAGAVVGMLERIIMFILIINQQYGALGFVLTAKSITRYEKITKSSQFAEYYLIGTLLSTVICLVVTLLIY